MLTKTLRFDPDTLATLRAMDWSADGTQGKINGQLDRALYAKVNKALEAMGGAWNRKAGAHIFASDPRPQVEGLLESGTLKVDRDGFFETPLAVIDRMLALASPVGEVLEPSAGMGAIAERLAQLIDKENITCVEINPERAAALSSKGFRTVQEDFMDCWGELPGIFDRVFMNPPFENLQDVDHVRHAFDLLTEGGVLVAVMSEPPFFRSDKKAVDFRAWLDEHSGYSEQLPPGSFKESGTGVSARLVRLEA